MSPFLARRRRRGVEYLDDPACDPDVRAQSIRDVACTNRLLGGTRAALAEFGDALRVLRGRGGRATLLDVGTGLGDIPLRVREAATRANVSLTTIGLDAAPSLATASRGRVDHAVCGDALALPVADGSVDIVLCSQLLHHFEHADAIRLLRELDRVARVRVIVSDLRRSAAAAAGLWLASFPLRFHRVSRHDGVVSVMRGFAPGELAELVHEAVGTRPAVKRHLGWRVTASWAPSGAPPRVPVALGPLPSGRRMRTVDERIVRAPLATIFALAADVERWPERLGHYRYVRFHERDGRGGGIVEMSANRPFGPVGWPTWWTSEMAVASPDRGATDAPWIRFRHIRGITRGMDVEWSFRQIADATHVRIVHVWNGPGWPLIGGVAAVGVIGPVFVHGIASRTLAGLAAAAERIVRTDQSGR
ncbi:MAG: methyltransferase domain-containing protein [Gemmatimonadota bacterium]|nr:methyltransferase domain-containing protein [Gemmatimonadota bacterium]